MPSGARQRKILDDLDNSPHVPFLLLIIGELQKRNYSVVVTARIVFRCGLANLFHLDYKLIGHHSGKANSAKLQVVPFVRWNWSHDLRKSRT